MKWFESYFRIFKVLKECREKYPQYTVNDNMENAQLASKENRALEQSVLGVMLDIHMLSLTNYVVCTHTSNVSIFAII